MSQHMSLPISQALLQCTVTLGVSLAPGNLSVFALVSPCSRCGPNRLKGGIQYFDKLLCYTKWM